MNSYIYLQIRLKKSSIGILSNYKNIYIHVIYILISIRILNTMNGPIKYKNIKN